MRTTNTPCYDTRYQTASARFIIYLFLGNDSGTSITLEDM